MQPMEKGKVGPPPTMGKGEPQSMAPMGTHYLHVKDRKKKKIMRHTLKIARNYAV